MPDQCYLSFDRRTMIGETEDSAMKILQKVLDDIAAEIHSLKLIFKSNPALIPAIQEK